MKQNYVIGSKMKKFYFLSLLCLIPLFGFIIGIVLIIYAVFKFRSWKLSLVILASMLGGVILTIADRSYLKNQLKYGDDPENQLSMLALYELDQISKDLEAFKNKYGFYPDSLKQLEVEFPDLMIVDPFLGRNAEAHKFINFYYKKENGKYDLFSSGKDCIPFTEDDLRPRKPMK
jgi:hypothetical protein